MLPLAAIIETGNHIAQAPGPRYEVAQAFADIMRAAADEQSPWAAFNRQDTLWNAENIRE